MKATRYTEEQFAYALRLAETDTPVEKINWKMGISTQPFYRWKNQYGQMGVEGTRKLEQLVADLSLDKLMLQDVLSKNSKG